MQPRNFFSKFAGGQAARPLPGDWLVVLVGMLLVTVLFLTLWRQAPAARLLVRQGDIIYGTYSLDQQRTLHIHGPLGESHVVIDHGRVRFERSPCSNQYCVHQGWLKRAGQVAICLPNQVSLELLGTKKVYDTLNY